MRNGRLRAAALVLSCFLAPAAWAQVEQGSIAGSVKDESGGLIPNARVVVTRVETQAKRETLTNGAGRYHVPYLPGGSYEVAVELQGFSRAVVSGVRLLVGQTARIDLTLKPGALEETVDVTAETPIDAQSASLGNVVGSRQLLQLPLVGRNAYSLVTLAPGVVDRGNPGSGPIINGGRSNTSEILLDGAETRNATTNDIAYAPPLESVQEFRVITNGLSAEFGRSGSGVLTVATRSGTNEFHGSAYSYLRSDKLNANSWTNKRTRTPRSKQDDKQLGFTVGGPIARNRTFFFVNAERNRSKSPDNLVASVPTELQRAGDFSQTLDGNGNLIRIYDPLTTRPDPARPGRFIRDPFPGNRIPAGRLDPIALKLLQYYPLPNRNTRTQNFVQDATRTTSQWRIALRVDHRLGERQQLFAAFRMDDSKAETPAVNIAFPSLGTNGQKGAIERHPRSFVLSDTVQFRSNLVGEFRISLTQNHTLVTPDSFDFAELGFGASVKSHSKVAMFPRFESPDVNPLGPDRASLQDDLEGSRELQGHVTWIAGAHAVKSGAQFGFLPFNVFRPERPAGMYSFSRAFTQGPDPTQAGAGYSVATLLLGAPTGGQITDDPRFRASQKYYAGYVQDDWKLTSKLTLNLGLRWEYQTPWSEKDDQLAFFDPEARDPLTGQKGVLRFVGVDGNSRYQSDPDRNNFGPRLGLAWRLSEKSVVRAGYGRFFYPGSGGVGSAPSDLGNGFLATSGVFLGPPPFPNTPPPGSSLVDPFKGGYFTPPTTGVGGGLTTAFRDWKTPSAHQWNLSAQRLLPARVLLEAAYVGTRHKNIWLNLDHNVVSTRHLSLGNELNTQVPNPYFGIIPTGALSAATVARSQLLRPITHYTGITRFRDAQGDSWYHGATLRLDKRTDKGLTFQAAYTFSKSIDTVGERFGGRSAIIDPNDLARSKSVSDTDRTHVASANFIYELPFGPGRRWLSRGWLSQVIGGWQLSGIGSLATGLPVVITAPGSTSLPGVNAYANRLKSPVLPSGEQTLDRWFDTTAFGVPAAFTLGTDSRTQSQLRGPKVKRVDLLVSREQRLKGRAVLQLRAEISNALNTPLFGDPVGAIQSADFGKIVTGANPRQIQLGLRLAY